MQTRTFGAFDSPTTALALPSDNSGDTPAAGPADASTECAFCDAPADGYDARTGNPVCRSCARLRADGGKAVARPERLTKFQLRILALLAAANGAPKGVTVMERLREYYGDDINRGRLYPNLNELAAMGLVEKGSKDRRTNAYALTEAGVEALRSEVAWLVERTPGFEGGCPS